MRSRKSRIVVVAFTLVATVGWSVGVIEDGKLLKKTGEEPKMLIAWEASVDAALTRGRKEKKPVLIEFYETWHQWCRMLEEKTFSDEEIGKLSRSFACARVDAAKSPDLVKRYGVKGYPTMVFLNSRGEQIHRVIGFIPPRPFERDLKEIAKGREPEKILAKLERSNPTAFKPLVMLAVGYLRRQEWDKAISTYERALAVGPGPDATEQQEITYSLCQLYDFKKKPQKAEQLLLELLAAESSEKVKVHEMLGHVYLSLRRLDKAIAHFTAERDLVKDTKQREYLDRQIKHLQEAAKKTKKK